MFHNPIAYLIPTIAVLSKDTCPWSPYRRCDFRYHLSYPSPLTHLSSFYSYLIPTIAVFCRDTWPWSPYRRNYPRYRRWNHQRNKTTANQNKGRKGEIKSSLPLSQPYTLPSNLLCSHQCYYNKQLSFSLSLTSPPTLLFFQGKSGTGKAKNRTTRATWA